MEIPQKHPESHVIGDHVGQKGNEIPHIAGDKNSGENPENKYIGTNQGDTSGANDAKPNLTDDKKVPMPTSNEPGATNEQAGAPNTNSNQDPAQSSKYV